MYTGDTLVCAAAVHSGLFSFAAGGTVVVLVRPGQASYRGSDRNGVASKSFDAHVASFSVSGSGGVTFVEDRGPAVTDGGSIDWAGAVAAELRDRPGRRIRYTCPPGGQFYGYVWGTGVYTGDTLVCAAAVHSGLFTFATGGTVTIEIRPGQSSYQGSDRNGVASKNFGAYGVSFVVVR